MTQGTQGSVEWYAAVTKAYKDLQHASNMLEKWTVKAQEATAQLEALGAPGHGTEVPVTEEPVSEPVQ